MSYSRTKTITAAELSEYFQKYISNCLKCASHANNMVMGVNSETIYLPQHLNALKGIYRVSGVLREDITKTKISNIIGGILSSSQIDALYTILLNIGYFETYAEIYYSNKDNPVYVVGINNNELVYQDDGKKYMDIGNNKGTKKIIMVIIPDVKQKENKKTTESKTDVKIYNKWDECIKICKKAMLKKHHPALNWAGVISYDKEAIADVEKYIKDNKSFDIKPSEITKLSQILDVMCENRIGKYPLLKNLLIMNKYIGYERYIGHISIPEKDEENNGSPYPMFVIGYINGKPEVLIIIGMSLN